MLKLLKLLLTLSATSNRLIFIWYLLHDVDSINILVLNLIHFYVQLSQTTDGYRIKLLFLNTQLYVQHVFLL